jgi:hypothetical protein
MPETPEIPEIPEMINAKSAWQLYSRIGSIPSSNNCNAGSQVFSIPSQFFAWVNEYFSHVSGRSHIARRGGMQ